MVRFEQTVDAHAIIKERTVGLTQPYLFALKDEHGGMAVTENMEEGPAPAEGWMELMGAVCLIGVEFIARTEGRAAAHEFLARTQAILTSLVDATPEPAASQDAKQSDAIT